MKVACSEIAQWVKDLLYETSVWLPRALVKAGYGRSACNLVLGSGLETGE